MRNRFVRGSEPDRKVIEMVRVNTRIYVGVHDTSIFVCLPSLRKEEAEEILVLLVSVGDCRVEK